MMDKDKLIIKKSGGTIVDVSHHIVSGEWYRMHVDYSYRGDTPVEIVELEYEPELMHRPHICLRVHISA